MRARRRLNIIVSWLFDALLWLWALGKLVMDWIGRATLPADTIEAGGLVEKGLAWLFATPWWAPALIASAFALLLVFRRTKKEPQKKKKPTPTVTQKPFIRLEGGGRALIDNIVLPSGQPLLHADIYDNIEIENINNPEIDTKSLKILISLTGIANRVVHDVVNDEISETTKEAFRLLDLFGCELPEECYEKFGALVECCSVPIRRPESLLAPERELRKNRAKELIMDIGAAVSRL